MIEISSDKNRLDIDLIHQFLTETYWAKGRTIEEVRNIIEHSLNFGVYLDNKQIGYARICTDYTIFAYLMDVFILPVHRGKGYSKKLMHYIIDEPKLKNCKSWMLKTKDAQGVYKPFGFNTLKNPSRLMEKIIK